MQNDTLPANYAGSSNGASPSAVTEPASGGVPPDSVETPTAGGTASASGESALFTGAASRDAGSAGKSLWIVLAGTLLSWL